MVTLYTHNNPLQTKWGQLFHLLNEANNVGAPLITVKWWREVLVLEGLSLCQVNPHTLKWNKNMKKTDV